MSKDRLTEGPQKGARPQGEKPPQKPAPPPAPQARPPARTGAVNIVLDGAPGHEGARFVEVEDDEGRSISPGEWRERPDGLWALRIAPRRRGYEYMGFSKTFSREEWSGDKAVTAWMNAIGAMGWSVVQYAAEQVKGGGYYTTLLASREA